MRIRPLRVDGAWEISPQQHTDDRGLFYESFRGDRLAEAIGHRPDIVQSNVSISARGTIRGVHFADVPPSQGKYVTALHGAVLDVVVDIRVGSPTFGQWDMVRLDTADRRAVYLSEGLGHAICALADDSAVMYLVTATYNPAAEHGIHPLDPDLRLPWPDGITARLSPKDDAAPSLAQALRAGMLPSYDACLAYRRTLSG